MRNRTRRRQRRIYGEMWRAYYAVIFVASGGAIAYLSARAGNVLFALAIVVLTIGATTLLFARTFRSSR